MKKSKYYLIVLMACTMAITPMFGQSARRKIVADSKMAKMEFIKTDPMKGFFDKAYGYVIFPMWVRQDLVGGASGNGAVYERNNLDGNGKAVAAEIGFRQALPVIF
jgi:hypothetical protein